MTCAKCGSENEPSYEYCNNCGLSLRDPADRNGGVDFSSLGAVLFGSLCGILANVLTFFVVSLFGNGRLAAVLYLVVLLSVAYGFFLLRSKRGRALPAANRWFFTTLFVVMFGGLSLCSLGPLSALFSPR